MKIVCAKEKLIEGINMVQKAVSTKSTLPILEGILIEASDKMKLIGNDLELAVECFVDAEIFIKGSIVINSKMFGDIIRKMPDTDILLEVQEGNAVYIECENTHFKIKGLSSVGFPSLPTVDKKDEFSIEPKVFKEMIRQTVFAASIDESYPIFTGMLLECKNGQLSIVAADRAARMAFRKSSIMDCGTEFNVVIPARTLNEISKMIQSNETLLNICIGTNHIIFSFAQCIVMSRLLEGKYINYKSIMREDFDTKVVVNNKALLSSIERAMLISSGDKKHPVIFNIKDGKLDISCNTEFGEIVDELCIDMDGKEMNIGFNPQYFIESLRTVEDEKVEILFATNLGPATIKPLKDDKYAYIIGAVRI